MWSFGSSPGSLGWRWRPEPWPVPLPTCSSRGAQPPCHQGLLALTQSLHCLTCSLTAMQLLCWELGEMLPPGTPAAVPDSLAAVSGGCPMSEGDPRGAVSAEVGICTQPHLHLRGTWRGPIETTGLAPKFVSSHSPCPSLCAAQPPGVPATHPPSPG